MIKLKINNVIHDVKFISELNVFEYIQLIQNMIDVNLMTYLSAIIGKDIVNQSISSNYNLKEIENLIFNHEIDFTKIESPQTFKFKDEVILLKEKDLFDRAGDVYMYELYKESEKYGVVDLCLYTLAILISEKRDANIYDEIYKELLNMNWIDVLPSGFFFINKLNRHKKIMLRSYLIWKVKLSNYLKVRLAGIRYWLTETI